MVFFFLPESPRWLLEKDRIDDARQSLLKLRGLKTETESFQEEFAAMVRYSKKKYEADPAKESSLEENLNKAERSDTAIVIFDQIKESKIPLMIPEVWKPLVIVSIFFVLQQFSGTPIMPAYTVDIVSKIGVTIDPYLVTVSLGVLQVCGNFVLIIASTRYMIII